MQQEARGRQEAGRLVRPRRHGRTSQAFQTVHQGHQQVGNHGGVPAGPIRHEPKHGPARGRAKPSHIHRRPARGRRKRPARPQRLFPMEASEAVSELRPRGNNVRTVLGVQPSRV